jgi:hypothetical protein
MIDTHLPENLDDILEAIGAHIGKPSFICGGSWPAMLISNAVFDFAVEDEDSTMVVEILDGLDAIELKSNDIDLYHGTDGNGLFASFGIVSSTRMLTMFHLKSTQSSAGISMHATFSITMISMPLQS